MKRLDINAIKGVNMKIDEKDLELDLYKLDEGWLDLPLLSLKWSQKLVETEMDTRNLKIKVEQLRATIDGKMRENPGEYGIQKITEGTITAAITFILL
jgi:FlaG/FlaF family flagellin (archaellin)